MTGVFVDECGECKDNAGQEDTALLKTIWHSKQGHSYDGIR